MKVLADRRLMWDVAMAGGLSLWLVLELAIGRPGVEVQPGHYALGLATTLPLAARSRLPVASGLGVQAAYVVGALVPVQPESLAQGLAVYMVATYTAAVGARSWRAAIGCGVASVMLLGLQGLFNGQYGPLGAALANGIYGVMVWTVAMVVRGYIERSARSSALAEEAVSTAGAAAHEAVLEERARLSRELHDGVAHALSIVVLRARGGLHEQRTDPEAGAAALHDVEQVAAGALADMRRLLELVHDGDAPVPLDPQPSLARVPDLVQLVNRSGVPTRMQVAGIPRELSPGLELSAFRVIQESLTNVARHSGGGSAEVSIRWDPDRLLIEVTDDGPNAPVPGTGRGLAGMRERVELFGGTLQAGPGPAGGFRVAAFLPTTP